MKENTHLAAPAESPDDLEELRAAQSERFQRIARVEALYGDENLPYDRQRLVDETKFFLAHSAEALLEAGRRLVLLKEHESAGNFYKALEEIGIADRSARKMMRAAIKFGSGPRNRLADLGRTKLLELMVEEDEDLDALAEGETVAGLTLDDVDRMTVRELREALRKSRAKRREDQEVHEKLLSEKDAKINDLDAKLHRREAGPDDEQAAELLDEMDRIASAMSAELLIRFERFYAELYELEVSENDDCRCQQVVDRLFRIWQQFADAHPEDGNTHRPDRSWIDQLPDKDKVGNGDLN